MPHVERLRPLTQTRHTHAAYIIRDAPSHPCRPPRSILSDFVRDYVLTLAYPTHDWQPLQRNGKPKSKNNHLRGFVLYAQSLRVITEQKVGRLDSVKAASLSESLRL